VDQTQVDEWYLGVVAKTICRMQRNTGGFLRDPAGEAWSMPRDGSGLLPRVFDLPMLLVAIVWTLVINPLLGLVVYLVPITETIQLFFGAALRAAFCSPSGPDRWYILMEWSPFGLLLRALEGSVFMTFIVWLISKSLVSKSGSGPLRYLMTYSTMACLARVAAVLWVLLMLLWAIPQMQIWEYTMDEASRTVNQTRQSVCMQYIRSEGKTGVANLHPAMGCANFHNGKPWFRDAVLTKLASHLGGESLPWDSIHNALPVEAYDVSGLRTLHGMLLANSKSVISLFFCLLLVVILVAFFLFPFFPSLVFTTLAFAGPAATLLVTALFIQYRIYGPLTGQPLFYKWFPFNSTTWDTFVGCCLMSACVMIPFYNDFQRVWHWYYLRSLQMNFFADGCDVHFQEVGSNAHCPLLLYTGTVSDYKHLDREGSTHEISFTPLHTGCEVMNYVRTPDFQSLAKCTALTAAGCLDAISLSMTNKMRFRFWLELLNLSWGDYVLFKRRHKFGQLSQFFSHHPVLVRRVMLLLTRLPNLVATVTIGIVFVLGWLRADRSGNHECYVAKEMIAACAIAQCLLVMLSFFGFLPGLGWLMTVPQHRQFHQATMFHFQDVRPPSLIYVTDGGVQDCTGIVQLLRRRCERILLVLAASDPNDELGVLRTAMNVAGTEKLASFYNPEDPRVDVRVLLDEYAQSKSMPYLNIGIHYGWGSSDPEDDATGVLLIVKNRLPPTLEKLPVQPLLTEEEIRSDVANPKKAHWNTESDRQAWANLNMADLGGLGCCDCCHRSGFNFGGKFPHLTGANYLWLTPQLFNSLCRLGHEVSQEIVEKIGR